jgi:lipid-A-disaccharide synthase
MNRLSIIGVIEVLKNLPQLLWLRYRIIRNIIAYKPDVFIGIDAPDFNFYIDFVRKIQALASSRTSIQQKMWDIIA